MVATPPASGSRTRVIRAFELDGGCREELLDADEERGAGADETQAHEDRGLAGSEGRTIFEDDVIVATERFG